MLIVDLMLSLYEGISMDTVICRTGSKEKSLRKVSNRHEELRAELQVMRIDLS
jgi:hypothetical protein